MTSTALYSVRSEAGTGPRIPPIALLGAFWVFQFMRTAFTDPDRDPFYVASLTSPVFQFIGPGLLLCMALVALFEAPRFLLRQYRILFALIGAMLLVFALSVISNDQSPLNAFQFFFGYLQFAILIPFSILCVKDRELDFRQVTKWILIPILVQFFINLGWALKFSPLQNARRWIPRNVDWAYGTLSNCTETAAIGAILVFFAFHILVYKPDRPVFFTRGKVLSLLGAGFLMMLWADSKLSYLSLAAATAIMSLLTLKMGLVRKITYTLVGFSLISCMFLASLYYNFLFNPVYSSSASFSNMVDWTIGGGMRALNNNPKLQVYHDLREKLPGDVDFPVFGGGPGNVTSRFAIKSETPLAAKYILPKITQQATFNGNSMLFLPNTGFNALVGDLGWLGVILYYGILMIQVHAIFKAFRRDRYTGLESTWAFVYLVFATYFIIHSLVDDKLYLGPEIAFIWILGIFLNRTAGDEPARSPAIRSPY